MTRPTPSLSRLVSSAAVLFGLAITACAGGGGSKQDSVGTDVPRAESSEGASKADSVGTDTSRRDSVGTDTSARGRKG
jgi:hypothetical protein